MGETNQILDLINERLEKVNLKLIVSNENDDPDIDDHQSIQDDAIYNEKIDDLLNIDGKEHNKLKVTNIPIINDEIYDIDGNKYRIEKEIVNSTNGIIYRMNKNSSCKIFKENCLTIDLYKKFIHMMNQQVDIDGVKWPIEFLFNESEKSEIVGYRLHALNSSGDRTLERIIKLNGDNKYSEEELYSICFKIINIINELQKYHILFNHINFNDLLISEDNQVELINVDDYSYDQNQDLPLFNLPDKDQPKKLLIYKEQFLQVCNLISRVVNPIRHVPCDVCKTEVDERELIEEDGIKQCKTCFPSIMCELCCEWFKKEDIEIVDGNYRCITCIDKVQCPLCKDWINEDDLVHKEVRGEEIEACRVSCEKKQPCDVCKEWLVDKKLEYDSNDHKIKCRECLEKVYCQICHGLFDTEDIVVDNGKKKCIDCLTKAECEYCNKYHDKEKLEIDPDGKLKCDSCYNTKICEICNDPFVSNELFLDDGSNKCPKCLKKDPCHVCGDLFDTEELTYTDDGTIKCPKCLRKRRCAECDELLDKDELKFDFKDFKHKCSDCLKVPCEICNEGTDPEDLTKDYDGIYKCKTCMEKVQCDICNEYFCLDDLVDDDGKIKCNACKDIILLACDICGEEYDFKTLEYVDHMKKCRDCLYKVRCDVCQQFFNEEDLVLTDDDAKKCKACMEKIECDLCKKPFNIEELVDGDEGDDGMIMCETCAKKVPCARCKDRYNEESISKDADGLHKCNTCFGTRDCIYCGKEYRATGILEGSKLCEICIDLLVKIPCNRCRKHIYVHKKRRYTSFLKEMKLCKKHFDSEYRIIKCRKCGTDFVKEKNGESVTLCNNCNKFRNKIIVAIQDLFERIKTGKRKK